MSSQSHSSHDFSFVNPLDTNVRWKRRTFIIVLLATMFVLGWLVSELSGNEPTSNNDANSWKARKPNIVYVLADDLGYNELGVYGQKIIRTPNLDKLAGEGIRFTQHYSGSPVCASSRCVLMTGKHTGVAYVRGNKEIGGWGPDEPEGQLPLLREEVTIAELLKDQGYRTGAFGKWGLGGPGSEGHPCNQGFDYFYGYLCQRVAHNYYPTHLWRNHDVDVLGNRYFSAHQKIDAPLPTEEEYFSRYQGEVYAADRMLDEAIQFVDRNKDEPFFLYFATPVPHVSIQVPQDSYDEYAGTLDDEPYLGQKSYLPHPQPRAGYAAMITRMDRDIGTLIDHIKELGLEEDTIFFFSSDNGATFNGGTDREYFESNAPLRGMKTQVFEGGIRVPFIASWKGHIEPGQVSDHVSGFQDMVPTLMELLEAEVPEDINGISLLPTLMGNPEQQAKHEVMYWELGNQQAVRAGDWKLVRLGRPNDRIDTMLFNLADDIDESENLAEKQPAKLQEMLDLAKASRTTSEQFPNIYDSAR